MMRILIVSEKTDVAGSTYSTAYLAIGLSQRHQVFLACPGHSLLTDLIRESPVVHLPLYIKGKIDWQSARQLARIIQEKDIQIVNAQASKDRYNTILARWLCKRPVKLIHTRRQMAKSAGLASWIYEKGTDKMVAVSQGVKDSLTRLGIRDSHIEVIHNGTPAEKYQAVAPSKVEQLRKKYHIQPQDVVIGSVARLKEQQQILQALVKIRRPVKVIFVGIDEQPAYQPVIQQFAAPHEIYYTGSVSSTDVLPYYCLFTMHILASTIEGLSQALLEAMAMGVPVIATRMGGNPELIRHEENGLLFDNNDTDTLAAQIQLLAEDAEYRKKLADKARHTALSDFSMENTIRRYEQFFEKLLSKS